jgi:hypothetical protein
MRRGRTRKHLRKPQVNAAGCKDEHSRSAAQWGCFCSAVCLLLQVRGKSHLQAAMCADKATACAAGRRAEAFVRSW